MLPAMTLWRHRGRLLRAWWESPSGWRRIGRAALFAYALRVSVYLPFGVAFVDAGGAAFGRAMTFAFVYPALVVLWGFWRAHPVIGWSVWGLWGGTALFATFYALVYPGATISFHPPASNPFFPVHALGLSMWLDPIILPLMIVLWAWDRQLPLPLPDTVLETPVPARTRALLLGGGRGLHDLGDGIVAAALVLGRGRGTGVGGTPGRRLADFGQLDYGAKPPNSIGGIPYPVSDPIVDHAVVGCVASAE